MAHKQEVASAKGLPRSWTAMFTRFEVETFKSYYALYISEVTFYEFVASVVCQPHLYAEHNVHADARNLERHISVASFIQSTISLLLSRARGGRISCREMSI
jgi:hypothetical protein